MITKHIIQLIMVLCLGAFALPGYGQNYITDTDVIVYSQSQIASPILVVDTDGGVTWKGQAGSSDSLWLKVDGVRTVISVEEVSFP